MLAQNARWNKKQQQKQQQQQQQQQHGVGEREKMKKKSSSSSSRDEARNALDDTLLDLQVSTYTREKKGRPFYEWGENVVILLQEVSDMLEQSLNDLKREEEEKWNKNPPPPAPPQRNSTHSPAVKARKR